VSLFASASARAEQFGTFAGYEVHYNAVASEFIDAAAAKQFGLSRSKSRALLNVTVLKKGDGDARTPSEAVVTGTVDGQALAFRPIREPSALYYVAEFDLGRGLKTYRFALEVRPDGSDTPARIGFTQELQGP
jgi:hypothetical protein